MNLLSSTLRNDIMPRFKLIAAFTTTAKIRDRYIDIIIVAIGKEKNFLQARPFKSSSNIGKILRKKE